MKSWAHCDSMLRGIMGILIYYGFRTWSFWFRACADGRTLKEDELRLQRAESLRSRTTALAGGGNQVFQHIAPAAVRLLGKEVELMPKS